MVSDKCKLAPYRYKWYFTPHTFDNAGASLSIFAYLVSVLVKDREVKVTGLSVLAG